MKKRYLRPNEVGEMLDLSTRTVYRLCESGEFLAFNVGKSLKICAKSVEIFIKKQIRKYQYKHGIVNSYENSVTDASAND